MKLVRGTPRARTKKTSIQVELLGEMIERGLYTQRKVAKALGMSEQSLSQHLRGDRKNPYKLKKILAFLGKDPTARMNVESRARGGDGPRRSAA